MAAASRAIAERIPLVDLVLEVRDARVALVECLDSLVIGVRPPRVRELIRTTHTSQTITLILVGIPNVGKSAIANSLHQVGRISAAEKGKLKHATVSPQPGKTKNISSLKIVSHPNIYVLDTPGVLPFDILDEEVCDKLTLTASGNVTPGSEFLENSHLDKRLQFSTDHTQDFIVNDVRRTLYDAVPSFTGNLENDK